MLDYFHQSIKISLTQTISQLAEEETLCHPSSLCHVKMAKERAIIQLDNTLNEIESILCYGIQIIKKEIDNLPHREKEKAIASLKEIIFFIETWECTSVIKFLKPPNQTIEPIYQIGRNCLLKKEFQEALKIFIILLILRADLEMIWVGFALAEQNLHHFDEAIVAYKHILQLNPNHAFSKKKLENLTLLNGGYHECFFL